MKTLFKKSLLVLIITFLTVFVLALANKVSAASETVDWTAAPTTASASTVVWEGTQFTITLAKNTSQTAANNYLGGSNAHTRIYKDQTLTFAPASGYKIDSIVITATSSSYATSFTKTWSNATATSSGSTATVTPTDGSVNSVLTVGAATRATKIVVNYSVAGNTANVEVTGDTYTEIDDAVTLTATLTNITGTVTWSSSNTDVATVDANGKVTAKAFGQTTITANCGGTEGTLLFTVYPTDGSEITIAEALEICKLSGETNSPYKYSLTATITSIDEDYSEQFENISVTVSDETSSIKVYRLTGGSELLAGDNITVTGYLVNYKGNTPEFAAGCTYVKHVNESIETIRTALNEIKAYMSLAYKYSVIEPVEGASQVALAEPKIISFDFGAQGTASHNDGSEISVGKTYTSGNYTLKVDEYSKVYDGARDAKGNSCLKFGTSKLTGNLQFTVPEEVTSVVIYVAKYKSDTTKVSINETTYTLTKNSNDGEYDILTIDTSSNKIVKIATVSGGIRCMLNQIDYVIESQDPESPTIEYSSQFKIKCGVDASIKNISSLVEGKEFSWGIEVSDGMTDPRFYASNSEYMLYDDNSKMQYVIIDLGDVLNNITRAQKEFTVRAYVEVDGFKYYSSEAKTYSVASIVDAYCGFENLTEEQKGQVNSLNDVLTSLGC